MRIDPLPQQPVTVPLFITHADQSTLCVAELDGTELVHLGSYEIIRFLRESRDRIIYSLIDLIKIVDCIHPKYWKIIRHGGRYVKAEFIYPVQSYVSKGRHWKSEDITAYRYEQRQTGTTIFPLASYTKDPRQLAPLFERLMSAGIPLGSLSTMARNSWRRTLPDSVTIGEHRSEWNAGSRAFIGGRREAIRVPATYIGTAYLDKPAAYLQAMRGTLPTKLIPASPNWYGTGIARAHIEVPSSKDWFPLPATRIDWKDGLNLACFGWGTADGFWTFEELRYAQEWGCKVEIIQAWKGVDPQPIFDLWLDFAQGIRALEGPSGKLAKVFANRLYGTFGTNSKRRRKEMTFFDDGTPKYRTLAPIPGSPETVFVAGIISSRNRLALRVLTESGAVLLDTDGGIVPITKAASLEQQGWKRKGEMSQVIVYGQNSYRYKCMEGIRNHWGIDGCVNCYGPRWHRFTDGIGYEDALIVPAQPFEEFLAS